MKYIKNETILNILENGTSDEVNDIMEYLIKSNNNNKVFKSYSLYKRIGYNDIRSLKDRIDWKLVSVRQNLSEDFIRESQDEVNWHCICLKQKLSEEFIREFKDKVDWSMISKHQNLSENFIREFQDRVNWLILSSYQSLSEEFIREFQDKVDWYCISGFQILSGEFIKEFKNRVNWSQISGYQLLSQEFIRGFQDILGINISRYQILSTNFIDEFMSRLDYNCLLKYQKLTKRQIIKIHDFHRTQDKNQIIKSLSQYNDDDIFINLKPVKVHKEGIYGYKIISNNNKSLYYNQLYEIGRKLPKVNCDITNRICSNGYNFYLSIDEALKEMKNEPLSSKLIKVYIEKEDIGVILEDSGIGRSYGLSVVEFVEIEGI